MSILLKTSFDESFYFNPISNPFFIRQGEDFPSYDGFVFSLQNQFGDQKYFDLENYTIKFKMYNESDILCAIGLFNIVDAERSKIEYKFQAYDTKKIGNYYAILEFIYSRPSVPEVLPTSSFSIDFVSSYESYTYGVGNFKVEINGINLVSQLNLIIDENNTKSIISEKINDAINDETINHGFSSSFIDNLITITGPTGSGSSLNEKSLLITCDDKIVVSDNSKFSGGVDPISSLTFNYSYPKNKNIFRIIVR